MVDDPKGARERAESKFAQAQRTSDEAKALAGADLDAARKKTERLRKLRLAKEAGEGVTQLDKKPVARKKRKATRPT